MTAEIGDVAKRDWRRKLSGLWAAVFLRGTSTRAVGLLWPWMMVLIPQLVLQWASISQTL